MSVCTATLHVEPKCFVSNVTWCMMAVILLSPALISVRHARMPAADMAVNGLIINLKSSVFWDITLCSAVKVNRHFVGTYHLHHQGLRVSQARNQHEAGNTGSKRLFTFTGLHSVISQKTELFRTIAVRASNPTVL
jgi:hypothetical protein